MTGRRVASLSWSRHRGTRRSPPCALCVRPLAGKIVISMVNALARRVARCYRCIRHADRWPPRSPPRCRRAASSARSITCRPAGWRTWARTRGLDADVVDLRRRPPARASSSRLVGMRCRGCRALVAGTMSLASRGRGLHARCACSINIRHKTRVHRSSRESRAGRDRSATPMRLYDTAGRQGSSRSNRDRS